MVDRSFAPKQFDNGLGTATRTAAGRTEMVYETSLLRHDIPVVFEDQCLTIDSVDADPSATTVTHCGMINDMAGHRQQGRFEGALYLAAAFDQWEWPGWWTSGRVVLGATDLPL